MSILRPQASVRRLELQAKRVKETLGVLAKYRLTGWLHGIPLPGLHAEAEEPAEGPIAQLSHNERIRLALAELGTTYIKLGQMLSTRPDLMGPDLAEELSKLQSHTPPNSAEVVSALIEQEFGKPPSEVFAAFEAEAFASASVAQVHRAQLPTGEQVVVKIQKQGIRKKVEEDLMIMNTVAELVEKHSSDLRRYHPVDLVAEFHRSLMSELDFTRERRNLETFTRNFADDPNVRFPKAWPEFSTQVVLTMDFMDGILGSDSQALLESCADLRELARKGATAYLDMIFRDSFYHADPHPGNLMLMPDDAVGIIDCGMVGRLDEKLREDFETLILSVSQGDAELLANALWKLSEEKPAAGVSQLQADLSELLAQTSQVTVDEINMAELLGGLTDILKRYKISLQPSLSQLLRTLILLEGTSQRLDPKFSLTEVIDPYCEKLILQRFSPQRIFRRLTRSYRDWDRLLETFPRDTSEALSQLQSGNFRVQLEHRHLDEIVNRLVFGVVLSALLLGSSLLWCLKAPPFVNGVPVLGVVGYLLAVVVGWLLFRSIQKSGKLSSRDK